MIDLTPYCYAIPFSIAWGGFFLAVTSGYVSPTKGRAAPFRNPKLMPSYFSWSSVPGQEITPGRV